MFLPVRWASMASRSPRQLCVRLGLRGCRAEVERQRFASARSHQAQMSTLGHSSDLVFSDLRVWNWHDFFSQ